ncbi:40S ribosomal protein [Linnemannia elongata]|nr:40S ribosomal protein [Linnemannia elongata]
MDLFEAEPTPFFQNDYTNYAPTPPAFTLHPHHSEKQETRRHTAPAQTIFFSQAKQYSDRFALFSLSITSWIKTNSGISRDSRHKRSASGAKRAQYRKKRKFELGRQAANTKLGAKRIHEVRTRGGNRKFRAMRLDAGNFSWGSEAISRKTRIVAVVYNASNNELVRTGTLVKNAIVQIDATPFRQWYEAHYATPIGARKGKGAVKVESEEINKARSNHVQRKIESRKADAKVDPALDHQFAAGRLYACLSSRPGQSGRADGYILEGQELAFYIRKLKK